MLFRHASDLPQSFLYPFGKGFKGFAKANAGSLRVGIGEHKMIEHMGKHFACNGDAKILHMRKVGLSTFARKV